MPDIQQEPCPKAQNCTECWVEVFDPNIPYGHKERGEAGGAAQGGQRLPYTAPQNGPLTAVLLP